MAKGHNYWNHNEWTVEKASAFMRKVDSGKQLRGLTYWSAFDFMKRHI